MTRIAVIGDVHDRRTRLASVLRWIEDDPPRLALLVGDLGLDPPFSEPARTREREAHDRSVREVLATVRARLGCPVLFVPGNHDLPDPDPKADGINCDRRVVECAGLRLAGFGGAGPTRFGFPYEWTENEAGQALRDLGGGRASVDLFLCHTPPAGTGLDRTRHGEHVGSGAVRNWIVRNRPTLAVCGHIHEAWGLERVDGVPCVNAGALGEPYDEELLWVVGLASGRLAAVRSYHGSAGGFETRDWL